MTLVASRTTVGFERIGNRFDQPDNGTLWELKPSEDVAKGDMLDLEYNKVVKAAANADNVVGIAAESLEAHATDLTKIRVYDNPFNIYRCSFEDHRDSTATGSGSTTTLVDSGLANTADAYRGATLYIYEGAGAGHARTISAYNGTDTLTWIDPLPAATDTTSKYILVGVAAVADMGIARGSVGVDIKDENTIDASATMATEAGPLVVVQVHPERLMMDVMIRKHLFNGVG